MNDLLNQILEDLDSNLKRKMNETSKVKMRDLDSIISAADTVIKKSSTLFDHVKYTSYIKPGKPVEQKRKVEPRANVSKIVVEVKPGPINDSVSIDMAMPNEHGVTVPEQPIATIKASEGMNPLKTFDQPSDSLYGQQPRSSFDADMEAQEKEIPVEITPPSKPIEDQPRDILPDHYKSQQQEDEFEDEKDEYVVGSDDQYPVDPNAKPTAVVIHCSDPRFNYAFRICVEKTLGLQSGDYLPLIFGGGAGVLAHPFELPKETKFVKDRLEYWKTRFPTIKRIILINHEDCRYYHQIKEKLTNLFPNNALMDKVAKMDLITVAKLLKSMSFLTGYSIEVYYAKFKDETHQSAMFEQVV